jgi:hypothetical protein
MLGLCKARAAGACASSSPGSRRLMPPAAIPRPAGPLRAPPARRLDLLHARAMRFPRHFVPSFDVTGDRARAVRNLATFRDQVRNVEVVVVEGGDVDGGVVTGGFVTGGEVSDGVVPDVVPWVRGFTAGGATTGSESSARGSTSA